MMTFLFVIMTAISFIFGYYIGHKACENVANVFLVKYMNIIINDLYTRQGLDLSYIRSAVQSANNFFGQEIITLHKIEPEED